MSEQLDPTNPEANSEPVGEPTETTTSEAATSSESAPEAAAVPAAVAAPVVTDAPPAVVETTRGGPSEYTPPERESRNRRAGSDVRLEDMHYRNIPLLSRFIDGRGRILSRRKTRVSAKMQRQVVKSIKHARHLALLPYTADQTRIVRKRR